MLPFKKIYVDSRFKTPDSNSHTDFSIDLGVTCNMPEGTHYYIDDVNIPNSWYSVEKGVNSKLYLRTYTDNVVSPMEDYILDIPSEIYNGDSFQTAIENELAITVGPQLFTVLYNPTRHCIHIDAKGNIDSFRIMTDDDLRNPITAWGLHNPTVRITDLDNLGSMNQVIKNYYNGFTRNSYFTSGFLDFLRYNNIYMSSNIGGYETLGPSKGQTNVIRKIPVTAGSGMVINDRVSGKHDILSCSKISLSTMSFTFHDVYGKIIDLNGTHVSFSLVFTSIVEDQ